MERAIVEATRQLRVRGDAFVVATVLRVQGSAYRRAGARMLITRDGWHAGSVSGGCVEGDLLRRAWWLTEAGPAVVTYDSAIADDDGDEIRAAFGLGCGGVVDVLLERSTALSATGFDPFELVARWYQQQRRGTIATTYLPTANRVERTVLEIGAARRERSGDEGMTLVEAIVPPPRLFVFGTGHDAVPVASFARALGWETYICARRAQHELYRRFPHVDGILVGDLDSGDDIEDQIDRSDRAIALVMSHHLETDREHLAMVLGSNAKYIGVLGPARRTRRILGELGVDRDPRLHAPVGLELGAESPEEIALSIVSEIQATLARAPATSLREHVGPIHAWAEGGRRP